MLDSQAEKEVSTFIDRECEFLVSIRGKVLSLIRSTIKEILRLRSNELDEKALLLERLSAINCELSESIHCNIRRGQLLAALGILRWQIVLWQRCFTLYHSPEHFNRWKNDKQVKESDLREFISKFDKECAKDNVSAPGNTIRYDDDRENYKNLSSMFHLNHSVIDVLYELCTGSKIDDFFRHFVTRFIFEDARNSMRILGVLLSHLRSITTESYAHYNHLVLQYNALDDHMQQLRHEFTEIEKKFDVRS